MFVDEIKVQARAGHGGKGCVAFHREAFIAKGGPSGGNGGAGGHVILVADHDINNLVAQYYQPRLIAERGQGGLGKGMDGRAGKDLTVHVPCGTLVWRLTAGSPPAGSSSAEVEPSQAKRNRRRPTVGPVSTPLPGPAVSTPAGPVGGEFVADLTEPGQRLVLCRGGRGGLGNRNFATARRQTPRFAQPGEPGEEGEFLFELRLLADVGLVGFPNAGKSTLLGAISQARPKIAPYPFTTLRPQVGILEYPDWRRLVVCDVPGLIAGAHRNLGLGHAFLRHIERCGVLAVLLDMAGTDGRQPWDDYGQLLRELELYDASLLGRRRLIVANKMDEEVAARNLRRFKRRVPRTPVLAISAAFDQGLGELKQAFRAAVEGTTAAAARVGT